MNTKDFLRLGVPLGEAMRRVTDFMARLILGATGARTSVRFTGRGGEAPENVCGPRQLCVEAA